MSSPDVFDVVQNHLKDNWTSSPLVYENGKNPTGSPAEFIMVELFCDSYDQASIGADPQTENIWRENGRLMMHVMVRSGTGSKPARVTAKQLVNLFKGREINNVKFRDASVGNAGASTQDGNYWGITASIQYQFDEN